MYDRILLAVDGSDEAKTAAKRGLALAAMLDAAVDVLHVVPRKSLRLTQTADERERLRERGESILSEIEAVAAESARPVETHLSEGKPTAQILERAGELNADLVVIGRQGLTGLGKRLLGGVTEQVLRRSEIPVFVVPGGDQATEEPTAYARVLVPTDGSENAEAATRHGVALARACGAAVHVLNVVDLQDAGGPFDAGGLDEVFVERLEARGREAVESVASEIEETAPELDVRTAVARTKSFDGAGAGVGEYVETNDIDLVVMGSRGRSNIRRQLLGSVASTVLRTVDVPVLLVERPAREA